MVNGLLDEKGQGLRWLCQNAAGAECGGAKKLSAFETHDYGLQKNHPGVQYPDLQGDGKLPPGAGNDGRYAGRHAMVIAGETVASRRKAAR